MTSKTVYLGLGSNQGCRESLIQKALCELSQMIQIAQISSVYQTAAIGPEQEDFYNLVLRGKTLLEPLALLEKIKHLEKEMGRKETFRWGPRVIDIDILIYDDYQVDLPELIIPHPQMINRRFVLEPLLEIAGNLPINNQTFYYYLNKNLGQRCEKIKLVTDFHSTH